MKRTERSGRTNELADATDRQALPEQRYTALIIPAQDDVPVSELICTGSGVAAEILLDSRSAARFELDRPPALMFANVSDAVPEAGNDQPVHPLNPVNRRAMALLKAHHDATGLRRPLVVGPVVVLGPRDEQGHDTAAPDELLRLMRHQGQFRMQVEVYGQPGRWSGNDLLFDQWLQAYEWALELRQRWMQVQHVRAVPALPAAALDE